MSPEPSSSASLPQNPAKRKADSLASRLSPVAVISNSAPAAETGDKNALFARLGEPLPSPALSWAATTSDPPQQRAGKRARTEPTSLLKRLSVNATGQSSDALISRNGDGTDASLLAATPMHGGSKISPRSDSPNDARNKRSIPLMGSTLASGEGNGAGLPIKRAKANSANPPPAVSIRNAAMTKSTSQNPPKVAAAESPRTISPTTSTAGLGSFSILGAAKKNRGTTPTTIQPHPQLRPPPVKAGPGSLGDARSVTESSSAVPALAKRLHMMNARVGEGVAGRRKRGGIVPRGSDQRMR
ncbi:hypothetical protein BS47DRAFT_749516 [Hydnum rufescens UP504]|uniref:Uncharacterized protein n=1 Tax=Hydnum rufescens UP504 TaxID=1448309 RepID=A0A9P6E1Y1_9AGAM|nr:hypothetical protein BS47DRAFT_749516 [Hydnum rufescens UP504]